MDFLIRLLGIHKRRWRGRVEKCSVAFKSKASQVYIIFNQKSKQSDRRNVCVQIQLRGYWK